MPQVLLRNSSDASLADSSARTALHWAAYHGHAPCVEDSVAHVDLKFRASTSDPCLHFVFPGIRPQHVPLPRKLMVPRHLPTRRLPADVCPLTFAHTTFARGDVCPRDVCPPTLAHTTFAHCRFHTRRLPANLSGGSTLATFTCGPALGCRST